MQWLLDHKLVYQRVECAKSLEPSKVEHSISDEKRRKKVRLLGIFFGAKPVPFDRENIKRNTAIYCDPPLYFVFSCDPPEGSEFF